MNARFITVVVVIAAVHLVLGALLLGTRSCRSPVAPADRGEDYRVAGAAAPPATVDTGGIEVSAEPPPPPPAPTPAQHVVKPGESYWALARRYGITVKALRDANGHAPDHVLKAGEKLKIPRPTS